jgi:hypothetical protein
VAQLAIGSICEIAATGTVVGIETIEQQLATVALFPNPASNQVKVLLPENLQGTNCTLMDVVGTRMYSKTLTSEDQTLNLEGLVSGLYLVRLNYAGIEQTLKLVHLD